MTQPTPSPDAPLGRARAGTGTAGTRALGLAVLVGIVITAWLGLVASPPDVVQDDAVRLMYVHVPSAWLAYLSFAVTAGASALWLWRRTRADRWDLVAGASAEIGVVFCGLTLLTGMVWGRATWGVFWTWDARLTTTALLFLLYLGYLALRRSGGDPAVRSKRAAIAALIAFADVPVVHQSVNWWRTLHQEPSVLRPDLDVQLEGLMLTTLLVAVATFTVLYGWLLTHRFRLAWLEREHEERGLELAIAERRAEAGTVGPPDPARPPAGGTASTVGVGS